MEAENFDDLAVHLHDARLGCGRCVDTLLLEERHKDCHCEKDDSPNLHEATEGDVSQLVEGKKASEGDHVASLLAHRVARGRIANVARRQHRQCPAVDGNILRRSQQVAPKEEDSET